IPISVDKNSNIDFLAYIIANKEANEIVITFRGTDENSFANVNADIGSYNLVEYSPKPNNDIRVSEGFFTAWQRFDSSNLTGTLTLLMKEFPSFKVSVTGHSLGGALFQTLDIKQNYPKASLCFYGFNMPRGGN
ncbi:15640_t:CDS:2, partial [Dentiscutata heterogama]